MDSFQRKLITTFKSFVSEDLKTTITKTSIADFCDDQTTVTVEVSDANNDQFTFHVQTTDGKYRGDLGCWLMNEDESGDTDHDVFPSVDFDVVIEAAETYLSEDKKYIETGISDYCAWIVGSEYRLVTHDDRYINKDTSSYQRKYSDVIATFSSIDDLKEFAKNKELA